MVAVQSAALVLAFTACIMLGATNFLMAYAKSLGQQPITTIGFYWLLTGLLGIVWVLSVNPIRHKSKNGSYRIQLIAANAPINDGRSGALLPPSGPSGFASTRARYQAIICMFASGVCSSIGVFFIRLSLTTDRRDQGPLMSIVATDVIVTTLTCHIFLRERLSATQWLAVLSVFIGMVIMCFGDNAGEWLRGVTRSRDQQASFFTAFVYACYAAVCFVGSNMNMKIAFLTKVTQSSANLIRFFAITFCGVTTLILALYMENVQAEFVGDSRLLALRWSLTIGAVVTGVVGRIALCKSMQYECTGISLSIIGSNSIVVLLLTTLVSGMFPTAFHLIGMLVIVSGVVSMSLMAA